MTTKCSENECQRPIYQGKHKCVLHCDKNIFLEKDQNCFNEEIIDYLLEQFLDSPWELRELLTFDSGSSNESQNKFYSENKECKNQKKHLKEYIFFKKMSQVKITEIIVDGIHFPKSSGHSAGHYSYAFSRIKKVYFNQCYFYGKSWSTLSCLVSFEECTFLKQWKLINYKALEDVIYQDCLFEKKLELSDEALSRSQFNEKCRFNDGLELRNIIIKANVFLVDSPPDNNLSLSSFGLMKGEFKFTDCIFSSDQEIYLANAEEASFLLERCKFEKKFKIRGLEYKGYEYQQAHKVALKSLKFDSCQIANNDDSYLRVGFLKNCEFSFKNFKNQSSSELNIGDCHFKLFELTNFRNLGKFKLFKINIMDDESGTDIPNPCFKIDNTSIGNADFQSIDLTTYSKVFMFDNIFSEIDYTNVMWPKSIEVKQFKGVDGETSKKRDTYRTLKNIALKNNDQPQALTFYAKEMENHDEMTKWGNSQFGDKLTLRFNQFTNQFGMSWARPLGYLIYLSILFYGFLLISIGGALTLEHYWIFLNPMHKTEFIGEWNSWTYFIDLIFRVIQALLIYQTIQAFRKFTRPL